MNTLGLRKNIQRGVNLEGRAPQDWTQTSLERADPWMVYYFAGLPKGYTWSTVDRLEAMG